jgi:cytochrome P450
MPQEDIESHAGLLIVAGSETTATLLSGCTFLLLSNPNTLDKLTKEVRSTFKEESEITIASAGQLEYMLACLDEALRCYPPVPIGNPRVVPKGGRVLCGRYVPEDVSCLISS